MSRKQNNKKDKDFYHTPRRVTKPINTIYNSTAMKK